MIKVSLGILEVLATILIVFSVIKILVLLVSPKSWLTFTKNFYANPKITSFISLILALIVLYYLLKAEISIIEILAITLFVSLLVVTSAAKYAKELIKLINIYKNKDLRSLLKEDWLLTLVWILLLIWGIREIFFS